MENALGTVFFSTLIIGMGALIYGSQKSTAAPKRRLWQTLGLLIEGAAFLIFGLGTLYLSNISAKPEITGAIANLHQFTGKYPSSQFDVVRSGLPAQPIHADYNGPRLVNEQVVRVHFIQYDQTLLDLSVLSGEDAGWELYESDGSISCEVLTLMGLACVIGGWWQWRKMPTIAEKPEKQLPDDRDTNEPDPSSMLDLR